MMQLAAVGTVTLLVLIEAIHWSTRLLVPSPCSRWRCKWRATVLAWRSWWRCNWRRIVSVSVFMISGIILLIALGDVGRFPSLQWLSSLLNILATIAGFWLGMILTRAVDSPTISLNNLVQVAIWVTGPLVFLTAWVLSPLSDTVPHSAVIFLWAIWLPILGVAARRRWPWLF